MGKRPTEVLYLGEFQSRNFRASLQVRAVIAGCRVYRTVRESRESLIRTLGIGRRPPADPVLSPLGEADEVGPVLDHHHQGQRGG